MALFTTYTSARAANVSARAAIQSLASGRSPVLDQQLRQFVSGPKTLDAFGVLNALVGASGLNTLMDSKTSFIDGDLPQVTPTRNLTLVHAVRKPVLPPDFAPHGTAGDLTLHRRRGETTVSIHASIHAHWLSTGKVTCYAHWRDMVDDLRNPGPEPVASKDVAFDLTRLQTAEAPPDFDSRCYPRALKPGVQQLFPDTRSRRVTYSLQASSIFRSCYRLDPPVPAAQRAAPLEDGSSMRAGVTTRTFTIPSSARPPVPKLAYLVPAFAWRDTYEPKTRTWFSGRTMLLRAYFERPFLISGDEETVGVVLATPALSTAEATQPLVSRWGSDPTRPITAPILSSALTPENFIEPGLPVRSCQLIEGGVADIKPCTIRYATDRKLWFADIPINTMGAFAPFLRLAFVRWQPHALHGLIDPLPLPSDANADTRLSGVVLADFMQLAPNRWVSVQRRNDSTYSIAVSGVFPAPDDARKENPAISLQLQARWYSLGTDLGWRSVEFQTMPVFTYHAAAISDLQSEDAADANETDGRLRIASWSTVAVLPQSAASRKYRILLREKEYFEHRSRTVYTQFIDLP